MAKRRLKNDHKGILFALATEKFVERELRKQEDFAAADFAESLVDDYKATAGPVAIESMTKLGLLRKHGEIVMPEWIPVMSIGKTFERPDGVEVTREDRYVSLAAPLQRVMNTQMADCLVLFVRGEDRPRWNSGYRGWMRDQVRRVELRKRIDFPGHALNITFEAFKAGEEPDVVPRVNGNVAGWLSEETVDLLRVYFEAGHARAAAENELWRIIGKIILQAKFFEEVLDYWPGAIELEEKLFPARPLNQLIALSAEDKSKLCVNLASQGVAAPACAA